jgi:hypothetical protein
MHNGLARSSENSVSQLSAVPSNAAIPSKGHGANAFSNKLLK